MSSSPLSGITTLGGVTVVPILDSVIRRPPGLLYSNTPEALWGAHPDMLTAGGEVELFMGGYLVLTAGRVVLVDLGVGPEGWRALSGAFIPGGYFPDSLRVAGVEPADVTDVVFTHLHPDHVGWASREGVPCFPRATYRCHQADWAFFVEQELPDPTSRTLLGPVADRMEMWNGDGALLPGVDVVGTPGHTPGSSTIVLSGHDGSRAVLLGDVVHCPVELVDAEWETFADVDPELALATRRRMIAELEGAPALVGAAHFPALAFGRLLQSPNGRRWLPAR